MPPDAHGPDRPDDDATHPGEPGITTDRRPPFAPEDEATGWLFSLNRFGIRPGLRRINALLEALDHPEREVDSLVIAGTNGKGSTTRILSALLRGAGYRVAAFTSPHLLRVYERIVIDDRPCDPALFAEKIAKLRPLVERTGASWFETLTALALDVCRDEGVDILCCETGLGGRLDSSNALPALGILLTTVGLDHQRILGETRAEICDEKLGLLKPGVPLFCGLDEELRPRAFRKAVEVGCPCHFLDELAEWEDGDGPWRLVTRRAAHEGLPPVATPVLRRNVALAMLAVEELAASGRLRPVADPPAALADLFLPGRWQVLLSDPDWILDTAHNEQALCAALDHFLSMRVAGRRIVLFGNLRDKDLPSGIGERLGRCDRVLAAPVGLARSRDRRELQAMLDGWDLPADDGRVLPDVASALASLAGELRPEDTVLVTGSCFLVAEVVYRLGYRDIEETRAIRPASEVLAGLAGR